MNKYLYQRNKYRQKRVPRYGTAQLYCRQTFRADGYMWDVLTLIEPHPDAEPWVVVPVLIARAKYKGFGTKDGQIWYYLYISPSPLTDSEYCNFLVGNAVPKTSKHLKTLQSRAAELRLPS